MVNVRKKKHEEKLTITKELLMGPIVTWGKVTIWVVNKVVKRKERIIQHPKESKLRGNTCHVGAFQGTVHEG